MLAASGFVVMAMALGGGVDIFTVKDDIGRMNTVFKFYLQAWWLLALASGYFLWLMWTAGRFSLRRPSFPRAAWMTVFAVLAIGVLIYPVLGTNVRIRDRFDTTNTGLDGIAPGGRRDELCEQNTGLHGCIARMGRCWRLHVSSTRRGNHLRVSGQPGTFIAASKSIQRHPSPCCLIMQHSPRARDHTHGVLDHLFDGDSIRHEDHTWVLAHVWKERGFV